MTNEETQPAKLVALRRYVAKRIAQADAGQVLDESEVFGELQKKYPDADLHRDKGWVNIPFIVIPGGAQA